MDDKLYTFRDENKNKIMDAEHSADFINAEPFKKKIFLGKLGIYYKDFLKKRFVDYSHMTQIYKSVTIVTPDDSPPYEYYRIIIRGQDKEIANIIFGEGFCNRTKDNDLADELIHKVSIAHPEIKAGYEE